MNRNQNAKRSLPVVLWIARRIASTLALSGPVLSGLVLSGLVFFGLGLSGPLAAQLPDEFQNLQVLPKDIDQRQLIDTMRGFARGLGVRCQHCHIGEEGKPLSTFDFVSDDKETKQVARAMMRMNHEINSKLLPATGRSSERLLQVSCATCHHGQARPEMLEDVLARSLAEGDVESAIGHYRELRERFHGGFTYDFSGRTLGRLADRLIAAGQLDEAMAFLDLNLEFFPESWIGHYSKGELHAQRGELPSAIQAMEKAVTLQPGNPRLEKRLAELRQRQTADSATQGEPESPN